MDEIGTGRSVWGARRYQFDAATFLQPDDETQ